MAPRIGWKKNGKPCEFDPARISKPGEEWRDVVGWERFYRVSNLGRVYSLHQTGRFVIGMRVRGGYMVVKVRDGERRAHLMVHLMVLEAFRGPRPPDMQACHGPNGVKDNSASNLRWDTRLANMADKELHGTARYRGTDALNVKAVRAIRTWEGVTDEKWAELFGCSTICIQQARTGKTWTEVDAPPVRRKFVRSTKTATNPEPPRHAIRN